METIMGQSKENLLTITDKSTQGKISFFIVIGIIFLCYAAYNLVLMLWSQKKIDTLVQYKQELYRAYKKATTKIEKKEIKKDLNKTNTPLNINNEEIREKSSNPTEKDISDAMDTLEYFRRKKYLKGR